MESEIDDETSSEHYLDYSLSKLNETPVKPHASVYDRYYPKDSVEYKLRALLFECTEEVIEKALRLVSK
jgi:hypothetical protein